MKNQLLNAWPPTITCQCKFSIQKLDLYDEEPQATKKYIYKIATSYHADMSRNLKHPAVQYYSGLDCWNQSKEYPFLATIKSH